MGGEAPPKTRRHRLSLSGGWGLLIPTPKYPPQVSAEGGELAVGPLTSLQGEPACSPHRPSPKSPGSHPSTRPPSLWGGGGPTSCGVTNSTPPGLILPHPTTSSRQDGPPGLPGAGDPCRASLGLQCPLRGSPGPQHPDCTQAPTTLQATTQVQSSCAIVSALSPSLGSPSAPPSHFPRRPPAHAPPTPKAQPHIRESRPPARGHRDPRPPPPEVQAGAAGAAMGARAADPTPKPGRRRAGSYLRGRRTVLPALGRGRRGIFPPAAMRGGRRVPDSRARTGTAGTQRTER